jgi:hypothetical protein
VGGNTVFEAILLHLHYQSSLELFVYFPIQKVRLDYYVTAEANLIYRNESPLYVGRGGQICIGDRNSSIVETLKQTLCMVLGNFWGMTTGCLSFCNVQCSLVLNHDVKIACKPSAPRL